MLLAKEDFDSLEETAYLLSSPENARRLLQALARRAEELWASGTRRASLVAATATRLWDESGNVRFLLEGLLGLTAVSSGISLTSFIRRPEYRAATGAPPPRSAGDYGDASGQIEFFLNFHVLLVERDGIPPYGSAV